MNVDRTMQFVLAEVSTRHGVPVTALVGTAYRRRDRRAMWEAAWLYQTITGARAQATGEMLGRNHATVAYARRQIAVAREATPAYAADLDRLADEIAETIGAPRRSERALRAHFDKMDRRLCHRATKASARLMLLAQRDPEAAAAILARFEEDIAREHERSPDADRRHVGNAPPPEALPPVHHHPQLA